MAEALEIIKKEKLPLVPLRGIVVFPNMVVPLIIGRENSVKAVTHSFENKTPLFLAAQRDKDIEEPGETDIYEIGCIANSLEVLHLTRHGAHIVEGEKRQGRRYISDRVLLRRGSAAGKHRERRKGNCRPERTSRKVAEYITMNPKIPREAVASVVAIEGPEKLVDAVMANVPSQVADKQKILEENELNERLTKTLSLLHSELEVLKIEDNINKRVQDRMEKMQKKEF
jgi:ATP-dependent Lon protease